MKYHNNSRRKQRKESSESEERPRLMSVLLTRSVFPLFIPAVVFLLLSFDYIWVTEDAFITFQAVENFWQGYGPNFNRGLRVESFSHPLWFSLLCLLRIFGTENLPVLAAFIGIALSVSGLVLAIEAARQRLDDSESLFPLGAILVAVLQPFWQFSSSGLETGLTFFWIGCITWFYGKMAQSPAKWEWRLYLVAGLAPVIRPDLIVLILPVVALTFWTRRFPKRAFSEYIPFVVSFIAPGAVWQIFRMGYFGALFPNTYIAKEGLGSRWDQGFIYLWDLLSTYWLLPILAALFLLVFHGVGERYRAGERLKKYGLVIALALGGCLHALMVCRSGGDFMHSRLLLPALFAFACAGAVVPMPLTGKNRLAFLCVFMGWACWACLCARPPYGAQISDDGIADERQWYVKRSFASRPITLKDYEYHSFSRVGEAATIMARKHGIRALYWAHIGIAVGVMPDDIIVIDPLALNDHIGSRIELTKRGRPGHEKIVPAAWFVARYPPPYGLVVLNQLNGEFAKKETTERVEAAKLVLASPKLLELREAVAAPMDQSLFFRNILRAWRLTFMRIPADPVRALERFPAASQG